MKRILGLQKLESDGVECAGMLEFSTCSYLGCGNSTTSCVGCGPDIAPV